jgi:stage III sporulation protein AH
MKPSIQNMRKLLNRRTMTLLAVCLLLLAAVAANVIMNRSEEKMADAATTAVSVSAPGAQGSFFDMYRSERDSVRTQELAYLDAIVAQGGDEATLSEAQKQKMNLVDCMESELNTENLIRAKGFEEVIVSMHNGSVNVIVDADALTDEQVAQILDIVLRQTGETAENIKVSTAQ